MSKLLIEVLEISPEPLIIRYGRQSRLILENHQSLKILKSILSLTGVDLTAIGEDGKPVHIAVTTRSITQAQFDLFEAGVEIEVVDKETGEIKPEEGGSDGD